MRYAEARFEEHRRREVYRTLVVEHMRALDGAGESSGYYAAAYGLPDFDAEETIGKVITAAGLEVEDEST